MAFDGNEGEVVTLAEAAEWTANYRKANPSAVKAHALGANKISAVLNQEGAVGVRLYRAIDNNGNACLIMVGVDSSENDLTSGILVERMPPCPPFCGGGNELNGL